MHQAEVEQICLRFRAYFDYACISRVRLEIHHCMDEAAELRFIDSRDTEATGNIPLDFYQPYTVTV